MLPEYQVKEKDDQKKAVKKAFAAVGLILYHSLRSEVGRMASALHSSSGRGSGGLPCWAVAVGGFGYLFHSGFAILSAACRAGSPAPLRRVPTPLPPTRGGRVNLVMSRK